MIFPCELWLQGRETDGQLARRIMMRRPIKNAEVNAVELIMFVPCLLHAQLALSRWGDMQYRITLSNNGLSQIWYIIRFSPRPMIVEKETLICHDFQ